MERGLLWLPLLGAFIGLAWAGWREYRKVDTYRRWAEGFDHSKYDIYAVLGQKGSDLTWGKPSPTGPVNLQAFSLTQVQSIQIVVGKGDRRSDNTHHPIALSSPPNTDTFESEHPNPLLNSNQSAILEFHLLNNNSPICIPFTETALAIQWAKHLQKAHSAIQDTNRHP